MSADWMLQRVPSFAALPQADRDAIASFALLWPLFEARLMGTDANAKQIANAVDRWDAEGSLQDHLYAGDLAYFRDRYFQNGDFTFRFEKLKLRKSDMPDLVAGVICGEMDAPRDRVLMVLLIVWRFRNNLFHGEKWEYELGGQLDNFTHANAVLMRVLERHAGLN